MLNITETNFENEILKADKVAFVDFYATWCGPCKMMSPIVDELSAEYEGKAVFGKCDIDANMSIAEKYGIMSIPTFIIFKNGEAVQTMTGGTSKAALKNMIEKCL